MAGYNEAFARFYDALTGDVDYGAKADFLLNTAARFKDKCQLVLDLACGTGSLSLELARRGREVIAVDGSPEMLARAAEKSAGVSPSILYLCQDMEELDLYGTVELSVCMLDSLNHVEGKENLREVFRRVALFTEPDGLFIFDANTPYKHRQVLADNAFVYEEKDFCCVWQNDYDPEDDSVGVRLDFFVSQGKGLYRRFGEEFREYCYSTEEMIRMAEEAGFEVLEVLGDYRQEPPAPEEQRVVYVTRRK